MSNPDEPSESPPPRRASRMVTRVLLAGMLCLAVSGAAALAFTEETRWLRLGILAALWAALVGAFALARHRRELAADRDRSEELRRVYELELEREVSARHEYELEVEAKTRRRVQEEVRNEVREELDGLRTEMQALRQNLEALLGGEVLVERVALRAESTRLRSLSDQSRAARSAERALPAGSFRPGTDQPWLPAGGPVEEIRDVKAASHLEERRRVDSADRERTEVLPRYQESPGSPGLAVTQPMEFRPLRRRERAQADTSPEETSAPWLTLTPASQAKSQPAADEPGPTQPGDAEAEPAQSERAGPEAAAAEPAMAMEDPIYADPASGPSLERFGSWVPAAVPVEPSGAVNGNGGGQQHQGDEVDQDTGSHAVGQSVSELLRTFGKDLAPHHRHRRDEQ